MHQMNRMRVETTMIAKKIFCAAAMFFAVVSTAHAEDPATTPPDAAAGTTTTAPTTSTPPAVAPAAQSDANISLELNKLEPSDKGCRAYIVVSNPAATPLDSFRLDLVMFQKDGVIGRRFALDLGPLRPNKRAVKLFEMDGTKCEDIGSFLVNDVMECRSGGSAVEDCLGRMKVNSLTKVEISK
jgi:hypothetical protein